MPLLAGDSLEQLLRQLYLTSPDPAVCMRAAFALAHSSRGATASAAGVTQPPAWQTSLALLLGMGSNLTVSADSGASASLAKPIAGPAPGQVPACGIPGAAHAVEYVKLVSRAVTRSLAQQAADNNRTYPGTGPGTALVGPVVDFLMLNWQSTVAAVGTTTAWQMIQEVAAQEIVTKQQWQKLAAWATRQYKEQQSQHEQATGQHLGPDIHAQLGSVLGAAWSSVSWVQHNSVGLCTRLV